MPCCKLFERNVFKTLFRFTVTARGQMLEIFILSRGHKMKVEKKLLPTK